MNHRTEGPGSHEIPYAYRPWLLAFTIATLIIVFVSPALEGHPPHEMSEDFQLTLFPWIQAVGITVSNGMDVFSGAPVTPPTGAQRASVLSGLLVSFVIGPTLFFITWRKMKISQKSDRWHPPAFLLGSVLVASTAIPSLYLAVQQVQVSRSMREAHTFATQRDAMMHSLQLISLDARAYRLLPQSEGGGGGSFAGYRPPALLASASTYRCEAPEASDTVLTLRAQAISGEPMVVGGTATASGVLRFRFEEGM